MVLCVASLCKCGVIRCPEHQCGWQPLYSIECEAGSITLPHEGTFPPMRDNSCNELCMMQVLDSTTALAATGIGTPYYLSPEICHGQKYSFKSDIWSAGCILYEMTCGKRPFDGGDMGALMGQIKQGAAPNRSLVDSLPNTATCITASLSFSFVRVSLQVDSDLFLLDTLKS